MTLPGPAAPGHEPGRRTILAAGARSGAGEGPRGFYMLARRGGPVEEPYLYDDQGVPPWITRDPRRIPVLLLGAGDPVDLLTGSEWQLLTLQPRGQVTDLEDGGGAAECPAGWTVTRRGGDPGPVAGPCFRAVRALARKAERIFTGDAPRSAAAAGRHAAAVSAMYRTPETALAWEGCILAAAAALDQAGADTDWWSTLAGRREYAVTLFAVAARDLISPGAAAWSQPAYDYLTGPWRAATGQPPHPDDTAPPPGPGPVLPARPPAGAPRAPGQTRRYRQGTLLLSALRNQA